MPEGYIRGLSQYYVDGLERMEIWVNKKNATPLPFQNGSRIPIRLKIGDSYYEAGLRTTSSLDYVYICPDLRDIQGQKISLSRVLTNSDFEKNQKVYLDVMGNLVQMRRAVAPSPLN